MKFGEQLLSYQQPEWSQHYINYNTLKAYLNQVVLEKSSLEALDHSKLESFCSFVERLQQNIDKISKFYVMMQQVIAADIEYFNNKKYFDLPNELQKHIYQSYLKAHHLKEFGYINESGISKIIKKHDKLTMGNPFLKACYSMGQFGMQPLCLDHSKTSQHLEQLASLFAYFNGPKLSELLLIDPSLQPRDLPFSIVNKQHFIIDMDGVLYHGQHLLPGSKRFIKWLIDENKSFLFLTNASEKTKRDLKDKLIQMGILNVNESHFYTSALSTAKFIRQQHENARVFCIGEHALIEALEDEQLKVVEEEPVDYVVIGETSNDTIFNYSNVKKAINFLNPTKTTVHSAHPVESTVFTMQVKEPPKLVATNMDVVDRALPMGWSPSCGSLVAAIEAGTGLKSYFLGKPNPLMMTSAMQQLGGTRESTVIIGDRMDTDIIGGLEAGIETILLLSGVTTMQDLRRFPYKPKYILAGLYELVQVIYANTSSTRMVLSRLNSQSSLTPH